MKPRVVISRCLGFDACRYDAVMLHDDLVERLKKHVEFIPICPEMGIGLGAPRFPIRLVSSKGRARLIQPQSGKDLTEPMESFTDRFLSSLEDVDGFILKNRSPSCGKGDVRIYHGEGEGSGYHRGMGAFGGRVLEKFPHLAIEDEGRLKSYRLRDFFLTKLFCLSSFRGVRGMDGIVDFHARNKFLLMGFGQSGMRKLGNMAANRDRKEPQAIKEGYAGELGLLMSGPAPRSKSINVMNHIFGYLSKRLSDKERRFFHETVELYREGRIPLASAMNVLHAWALHQDDDYLNSQTIFQPFPKELMDLSSGGKPMEL